jgi:acyl-coenzyme A synthetase/AMP-(fatty) acid ligase/acyl carrier protein
VNYIEAASDEFKVKPTDRVLQFASINFDTSAEEIYPCLIRGATLVLRTNDMLSSAATFLQKCSEWGLTMLDLPTAYWHELTISIDQEELKVPENLRLVIIGGEKAVPEHIRTWQRRVGKQVRLVNTYGPTEGTIVATMYDLSQPRTTNTPVETLIGRPVRNVHAYILDTNLQPVPIGVPGELHLGGAGLARGYFNAPDITSQKFIPHPFSSDPQARLYKTGDLARYVQDGNIEFLGRVDHQVKIRGFRIELGEVESALSRHPAIRENVVVAREDEMGRKSLVAYFTVNPGVDASVSELRQFIKQNLPDYMMPASFVLLDQFPMTPNGKLDRKALPAPDQSRPELEDRYVAPRDEIEESVTNIFASVLKLERVGIQDNFFELGGHSLLATQVISRLYQQFNIDLPLHALFGDPTPEGLAALIMKKKVDQVDDDELAALLSQLENLSPEEANALLNAEE